MHNRKPDPFYGSSVVTFCENGNKPVRGPVLETKGRAKCPKETEHGS